MKKIIIVCILFHFLPIQAEEKKSTGETGATVQSNLSAELQNGKKKQKLYAQLVTVLMVKQHLEETR